MESTFWFMVSASGRLVTRGRGRKREGPILIIPVGHEDDTVRRLPWVTFFIIGFCVGVHILVSIQTASVRKDFEKKLVEFASFCLQHPGLEPDRETMVRLLGERNAGEFFDALEVLRVQSGAPAGAHSMEDQARLDELALDLAHTAELVPTRSLGYVPARKNVLGLLTGMFVHGGWLHLLGNLLFLYLTAPFIEDVWGRPLFLGFYLAAGVFSALMFGLHYPNLTAPLIGASGAIAGVMGAFLVRYWKTRIRFFYLFFMFVRGTFSAPAFIMLPLWFFLELFNAGAMDALNPGRGGATAHWAHVWGFAFGVGVALLAHRLHLEERYISPKIEAQLNYVDGVSEHLEEALAKKMNRRPEEAFVQALDLARRNPGRADVARVMWSLAVQTGRESEAAGPFAAFIEREVRRDQLEPALEDFRAFRRAGTGVTVSPGVKVALARRLLETHAPDDARDLLAEALDELRVDAPPGLLIDAAKLGAAVSSPGLTRRAIGLCLENPDIPADQKSRFRDYLDKLSTTGT
jgi:membrane associated rhomboid family serine protease